MEEEEQREKEREREREKEKEKEKEREEADKGKERFIGVSHNSIRLYERVCPSVCLSVCNG